MILIQIMYSVAAVVAIGAGIPQLRQLITTKNSDEFSIATWSTWLITQSVTATYFTTLGSTLAAVVSGAWVVFYLMILTLIMYYRSPVLRRRVKRTRKLLLRGKPTMQVQEAKARS